MNAQQLKNAILQEAIEGRLVPQDPNDEPASALLERIRKEKEWLYRDGLLKKNDLKGRDIKDDEVPFVIPSCWVWTKIDNIAFVTKLAGFEYSDYIANNLVSKDKGIPLFKGKNVQNGKIVYEFEAYIPLKLSNELKRSQINKKCLLTPYVGTIGNIGIHDKEGIFHLGSNVGKIEFYNGKQVNILEEYAKYYLMSKYGYQELTKYKKATAQESISIEAIRDVFIPIPPVEEQRRIVNKISSIFAKVEEYGKAQEKLNKLNEELPERLKKSVLQEAIEGRLVPQDPNDEPASVLLDKIRKEKEELVKAGKLKKKDLIETPITEDEIPFEIPESWEWVRLSNIVNIIMGQSPDGGDVYESEYDDKAYEFHQGKICFTERFISPSGKWCKNPSRIAEKGSLLVCVRAPIGDVNITQRIISIGRGLASMTAYCGIQTLFLYFWMIAHKRVLEDKGTGSTFKAITIDVLKNQPIPLPPLAEQHHIVEKLEQVLGEIDKLKK